MHLGKHIVITGPESSGKTTLASSLSSEWGGHLVAEYARDYLKEYAGNYVRRDLLNIAQIQEIRIKQAIERHADQSIICDTDLLTLHIWWQVKYGELNEGLYSSWRQFLPAFYLVCAPDIPWEEDPLREHPDTREHLLLLHLNEIKKARVPYKIIRGSRQQRTLRAMEAVKDILLNA